jgi:hypothetical protein
VETRTGVDGMLPPPRQLRRSARFRGRVAGWVRRFRRSIGRVGSGAGADSGLGARGHGGEL